MPTLFVPGVGLLFGLAFGAERSGRAEHLPDMRAVGN